MKNQKIKWISPLLRLELEQRRSHKQCFQDTLLMIQRMKTYSIARCDICSYCEYGLDECMSCQRSFCESCSIKDGLHSSGDEMMCSRCSNNFSDQLNVTYYIPQKILNRTNTFYHIKICYNGKMGQGFRHFISLFKIKFFRPDFSPIPTHPNSQIINLLFYFLQFFHSGIRDRIFSKFPLLLNIFFP